MPTPWPGALAGKKRVKTVRSGCAAVIATTFGRTRGSHGIFHSVSSANMRCISTLRWIASAPTGPYLSSSSFDIAPSSKAISNGASRAWFLGRIARSNDSMTGG